MRDPAATAPPRRSRLGPLALGALLVALFAAGAYVLLLAQAGDAGGPAPLPVAAHEQEVVWLYAATATTAWERLVAAVERFAASPAAADLGLTAEVGPGAFPPQTTAVPQVALVRRDTGARLVIRWYKLTSGWKQGDWVAALTRPGRKPPLAVIGGNSSDGARDLACQMQKHRAALPERDQPLLVLTHATADEVRTPDGGTKVELMRLYPGRTFRFCFTNRQMADAVTDFVWRHADLRPDADPFHVVSWKDDLYSPDLVTGFRAALDAAATREWLADLAAAAAALGTPAPAGVGSGLALVPRVRPLGTDFRRHRAAPTVEQLVDSSVGGFATANRFEAQVAGALLEDLERRQPDARQPLLVVTGQSQPTRRLLRAVARTDPERARRFVVVTGDTIGFNTVYRDRQFAWHIQDLPFKLVLFAHHNPTDAGAGFRAAGREPGGSTGTEDLLLYADIVGTLAAAWRGAADPGDRAEALRAAAAARYHDGAVGLGDGGVPLFTPEGDRRSGTGEHVVYVRPRTGGGQTLPWSHIEVWARRADHGWVPVTELTAAYREALQPGERSP